MKFSERWLRTMVDPALDTAGLCERLTMAGLEVESTEPVAPLFSGVVAARIDQVDPHPDADRLRLCLVDIGKAERLRIVCGAPNAAVGMKAPCAIVGASLPGGLRIAAATCAAPNRRACCARPASSASTPMPRACSCCPQDAPVGADVRDLLDLDDALITLKITPNRADCLSLLGIARDVAAIIGAALVEPAAPPRRSPVAPSAPCASTTPLPVLGSCRESSRESTRRRQRPPG